MVHSYVVGCGDVRKTTLIHELIKEHLHLKFHRIQEVARTVLRKEKIDGAQLARDSRLMWNLQSRIIVEQIKQESKLSTNTRIISDRSFLDAVVYALHLFAEKFPENVAKVFKVENVISSVLCNRDLGNFVLGLKERKCCLCRGSNLDADRVRQENGNFSKLKTIPKQMARFSLLLSNVQKNGNCS